MKKLRNFMLVVLVLVGVVFIFIGGSFIPLPIMLLGSLASRRIFFSTGSDFFSLSTTGNGTSTFSNSFKRLFKSV